MHRLLALSAIILLLPCSRPAAARQVSVPIVLEHEFLRRILIAQMYTGDGATARVWDDGQDCNFLILAEPRVDTYSGLLRIRSHGTARVGTAVGGRCLSVFNWQGTIETLQEPILDERAPIVRFRVFDSNLYGADEKKKVTGTIWDWVKTYVHPRLEEITIDLQSAFGEVRELLPLVLASDDAERTRQTIDSLSLAYLRANASGLAFTLHFDIAERVTPTERPGPEPTLSPDELQRWETATQEWDAFLTFVAKEAATDARFAELRRALFEVLIEGRRDILAALAPDDVDAPDPVRPLFIKSWKRLAPIVRRLHLNLPGEAALQYLTFATAADALATLDEIDALGFDISADGLRRLARILAPETPADPLAYDTAVDPELRELFGFGAPLPPPVEPEPTPDATSLLRWLVAPVWADAPRGREGEPPCEPSAPVTQSGAAGPLRQCSGQALRQCSGQASPSPTIAANVPLAARLNRWVPTRAEVPEYLPLVRELIIETTSGTLATKKLSPQFHKMYGWMMLATAWQESCWRQFIRDGDQIKPIMSPVGAVGLMQVHQRVWRGFYDLTGLRNDIAYNARAGSEILIHYLRDYAIAKGEHTKTGNVDNLARASYAVYNGGPAHVSRYRKPATKKALRAIDKSFWDKYQRVKRGDEMAVVECFGYY